VFAFFNCKHCDLKAASDKSGFIGSAERSGCPTGKAKGWAGVIPKRTKRAAKIVLAASGATGRPVGAEGRARRQTAPYLMGGGRGKCKIVRGLKGAGVEASRAATRHQRPFPLCR
jgi:hypothetical protein